MQHGSCITLPVFHRLLQSMYQYRKMHVTKRPNITTEGNAMVEKCYMRYVHNLYLHNIYICKGKTHKQWATLFTDIVKIGCLFFLRTNNIFRSLVSLFLCCFHGGVDEVLPVK